MLFIQFRSDTLSLCYIYNMQTPLLSTSRKSFIPEKEMTGSLETDRNALLSMNILLATAQGRSFRSSFPTSPPNFFPRVVEYETSNTTLQWQNFNVWLVHQKQCSSIPLLSVAMYTTHLCNTASHLQGFLYLGSQQQQTQNVFIKLLRLLTASMENYIL